LGLMKGEPLGHEDVIAAFGERDQARRGGATAREVDRVSGPAEQPGHLARPVFLLDVDEGLEFAQMRSTCLRPPLSRVEARVGRAEAINLIGLPPCRLHAWPSRNCAMRGRAGDYAPSPV
jgi:hypothetical protein